MSARRPARRELNNNTARAFGFSRGDITGWNAYPDYAFTTDARPGLPDRSLPDNGYHKVRLVHNGSVVRYYLDDALRRLHGPATDCITSLWADATRLITTWFSFRRSTV